MNGGFQVRPATPVDLPALGRMGAALVRFHHSLDAQRFMLIEPAEQGYARFLGSVLPDPQTVVLVAETGGGDVVGYVYGRFEERDWNLLLDRHGALHDVFVEESARHAGVAQALIAALGERLRALGAARVVLGSAWQNHAAQALFERLGFRRTMVEMTLEL